MRLSIRIKQIVGVSAIVGVAVVALSALYTNRLANVVLQESLSRGQMLAGRRSIARSLNEPTSGPSSKTPR